MKKSKINSHFYHNYISSEDKLIKEILFGTPPAPSLRGGRGRGYKYTICLGWLSIIIELECNRIDVLVTAYKNELKELFFASLKIVLKVKKLSIFESLNIVMKIMNGNSFETFASLKIGFKVRSFEKIT